MVYFNIQFYLKSSLKLLIIGKTGTGKSSLCNVVSGLDHDAKVFPVSASAESCTQSTQFADVLFNNDKSRPISVIDTIGFDDPKNDLDAVIIADLVSKLKNQVDYINTFVIAVNGQNPRLDGSLIGMIRIFEKMFGKDFWQQTLLVFTRLPMDKKSISRREKKTKQTDAQLAKHYLQVLQQEFPNGGGLDYLIIDACYEDDDDEEVVSFNEAIENLWTKLRYSPDLYTTKVQNAESESKKLKNEIEKKDKEYTESVQKMKKEINTVMKHNKKLEKDFKEGRDWYENKLSRLENVNRNLYSKLDDQEQRYSSKLEEVEKKFKGIK